MDDEQLSAQKRFARMTNLKEKIQSLTTIKNKQQLKRLSDTNSQQMSSPDHRHHQLHQHQNPFIRRDKNHSRRMSLPSTPPYLSPPPPSQLHLQRIEDGLHSEGGHGRSPSPFNDEPNVRHA